MLLAYVDESHNASRYWIGALICPETTLVPLVDGLDRVVGEAAAAFEGLDPHAELHGYPLLHGCDDWAPLKAMVRARIGIYGKAFDVIAASGAHIIIRGVDIPRLRSRYHAPEHPHSVVLAHLLERIDECAESLAEPVLVIADEVDQADTHRRALWHFQRHATGGYRPRKLRQIVDTIHFAPSEASRLVQAADLVAYLHQRIASRADRDDRAIRASAALSSRVAGRVWHQHCWNP